jgi:hypothetical protein
MRLRRKQAAKPRGANGVAGYHNQRILLIESRLALICLLLRFLSALHAHVQPRQALEYRR